MKVNLYLLLAFVGSCALINAEKDEIRTTLTTRCDNGHVLKAKIADPIFKYDTQRLYDIFMKQIEECHKNRNDFGQGAVEISAKASIPEDFFYNKKDQIYKNLYQARQKAIANAPIDTTTIRTGWFKKESIYKKFLEDHGLIFIKKHKDKFE